MIIRIKNEKEFAKSRIVAGYSQRKLGRETGISGAYLSQIERGERNPSPTVAKKIADALGKEFDDLFFIESGYKSERKEISKVSTS